MRVQNTLVGEVLRIIGILVILAGLFVGYAVGNTVDLMTMATHQNWGVTLTVWISSVVGGLFLLGLSEMVKYLYNIHLNTRPMNHSATDINASTVSKEA